MKSLCALLLIVAAARGPAVAETVTLTPAADTTLFEPNPDNNLGREATFVAGATARSLRGRALIRFAIGGQIPAGAQITSASLQLQVVKAPAAAAPSNFGLHRVLTPWGEGTKSGSVGSAASAGEATWKARRMGAELWGAPGGASDSDFSAVVSSAAPATRSGAFTIPTSADLVKDVQLWLDNSEANFGWMLRSDAEGTAQTARRIASRENAANVPKLVIEYSVGPPPLQFTGIRIGPEGVSLSWTGGTPPYQLQTKFSVVDTNWTDVGATMTTNTVTLPATAAQAFFRVRGSE